MGKEGKRVSILLMFTAVLGAILFGCTNPHTNTAADFVGTWTATKWTETNLASPYQTVDVLAAGGSWTITVVTGATYTGTVTEPGSPPAAVSGSFTIIDNSSMVVHQGSQTFNISYTLSGNTWTLTHADGTYDFGSGQQSSRQNITATRS